MKIAKCIEPGKIYYWNPGKNDNYHGGDVKVERELGENWIFRFVGRDVLMIKSKTEINQLLEDKQIMTR